MNHLNMFAAKTPDMEKVKQIVISIINGSPHGLAADLLDREYREWENHKLPFNRFGYTSLLQFIQEELKENIDIEHRGMDVILRSKSTNKSGHIVDLKKHEKHKNIKRNKANGLGNYQWNPKYAQNHPQHLKPGLLPTPQHLYVKPALLPTPPHKIPLTQLQSMHAMAITRFQQSLKNQMPPNIRLPTHQFNLQKQSNAKLHQTEPQKCLSITETKKNLPPAGSQESPEKIRHQFGYSLKNVSPTKVTDQSIKQADIHQNIQSTAKHYNATDNWDDIFSEINGAAAVDDMKINKTVKGRNNADCKFYDNSLNGNNNASISTINKICNEMNKIAMANANKIELKHVWTELKVGIKYDCILSDINCPSKFWIQLKAYRPKLISLVNDMTIFYGTEPTARQYILSDDDAVESTLYAVFYNGFFYRGQIEKWLTGDKVQIRFIDYGSRIDTKISKIYHLLPRFCQLPSNSICCSLGNILPAAKGIYTTESAIAFRNLGENKKLVATILKIDQSKPKVSVELTIKKMHLNINDELVRNGHAKVRPAVNISLW